jgi:hypothetical protein
VTLWKRSHSDLAMAAENLMALVRGEDSDEAEAGALLIAEVLTIYRQAHTR